MSVPRKHHYVPEFLIKQWADANGQVAPYMRTVTKHPQREQKSSPKAFCYKIDLLRTDYDCPAYSQRLESEWLSQIDSAAAIIHRTLIRDSNASLSFDEKCNWMRFIISLLIRQPSLIFQARNETSIKYQAKFNEDQELTDILKKQKITQTPAEYIKNDYPYAFENMAVKRLAKMCDDPKQMQKIMRMNWFYSDFSDVSFGLVLGDRPLIKNLGSSTVPALLALPLSPTRIWFAAHNQHTVENIKTDARRDIVMRINRESVNQATKWVFDKEGYNSRLIRKSWSY